MISTRLVRSSILLASLGAVMLNSACTTTTGPYSRADDRLNTSEEVSGDQLQQRMLLVGDAGKPASCAPKKEDCGGPQVLAALEAWAGKAPKKTFTLFLGDNIYEKGLPTSQDAERADAETKLSAQYAVLTKSRSKGMFVPGNHDWDGAFGPRHEAWERQTKFLKGLNEAQDTLAIAETEPGCPWPYALDLGTDGVRIIVMDTQWWLTSDGEISEECRRGTTNEKAVSHRLEAMIEEVKPGSKNPRDVIVATHHPLATHGKHGSWYRWFSQDLRNYRNRTMQDEITAAYTRSSHPPLIHAAGHDHSLQVLEGRDTGGIGFNLVSGAGSPDKISSVSVGKDTLFAHDHTGFMVIDFLRSGRVLLRVVEPKSDDESVVVYQKQLRAAGA